MKLALLLPGFLDSPDYRHMLVIEKGLQELGYEVVRLDPCKLWETGETKDYSITNYIKQIKETIDSYGDQKFDDVLLVGHSVGGFVAIIAGEKFAEVTTIVALCPPAEFDNPPVKWKDNKVRISRRALPEDLSQTREFRVPISFAYDSFNYNAVEAVGRLTKPLMIFIALDDIIVPAEETEQLVQAAKNPYVIKLRGIEHDFRNSEEESEGVIDEIRRFLRSLQ